MSGIQFFGDKILISKIEKIGIVHLQGVEKYLEKHNPKRCFLITPSQPHENVLKYAENIKVLKIIIASDFQEEKRKIEKEYPNEDIVTINPYQLAGRDGMLDGS